MRKLLIKWMKPICLLLCLFSNQAFAQSPPPQPKVDHTPIFEEIEYCIKWQENFVDLDFYKEWKTPSGLKPSELSEKERCVFFLRQAEVLENRLRKASYTAYHIAAHLAYSPDDKQDHDKLVEYKVKLIEQRHLLSLRRLEMVTSASKHFPDLKDQIAHHINKTRIYYNSNKIE